MFFVLLCCCLAVLCQGVLGESVLHIKNASDFIQFSKNVNSGTNYKGTTVFLDADIDFSGSLSEQFEHIGKGSSNYFQGTFNGQRHTISNLAINSSLQYVGLFGNSKRSNNQKCCAGLFVLFCELLQWLKLCLYWRNYWRLL